MLRAHPAMRRRLLPRASPSSGAAQARYAQSRPRNGQMHRPRRESEMKAHHLAGTHRERRQVRSRLRRNHVRPHRLPRPTSHRSAPAVARARHPPRLPARLNPGGRRTSLAQARCGRGRRLPPTRGDSRGDCDHHQHNNDNATHPREGTLPAPSPVTLEPVRLANSALSPASLRVCGTQLFQRTSVDRSLTRSGCGRSPHWDGLALLL